MENVKVTLHLSPEAAEILRQYAGERNRGYWLSQVILAQRQRDDAEGERIALELKAQAARQAAQKATEAAQRARDKFSIPTPGHKPRKGRK